MTSFLDHVGSKTSLKQRLSAYENNALTPKGPKAKLWDDDEEEEQAAASEVQEEEESDEEDMRDMSLQERMAAYQRGGKMDSGSDKAKGKGKVETAKVNMSLKDRMAAYQQGVPLDEDGPRSSMRSSTSSPDPDRELSLKERMAAFQQPQKNSAVVDLLPPKKKSPKNAEPKPDHKINLHDRMAAFGDSRIQRGPKKGKSELQMRMANFQGGGGGASTPNLSSKSERKLHDDMPRRKGHLQDRMAAYKETVAPGSEMGEFAGGGARLKKKGSYGNKAKCFRAKKQMGGDLEKRMSAFKEASSPPPIFQSERPTAAISEEERGEDLKKRMSAFAEASSPDAFRKMKTNSEAPKYKLWEDEPVDAEHEEKKQLLVLSNIQKRMDSLGTDESDELALVDKAAGSEEIEEEEKAEDDGGSIDLQNSDAEEKKPEGGGESDLQKRMSAFAEATSPDAFQKMKLEEGGCRSTSPIPNPSGGDLQKRMSAFAEAMSPDAFQKKKLEETGGRPTSPVPDVEGGHLKERMEKFKEVSAADAFQKKKSEERGDESFSPVKDVSGGHLQERLEKFKEVSSPEAFQKNKGNAPQDGDVPPPPFNPQDGEGEEEENRTWKGGKVVENKVNAVREGPKDYEYLYDLYVNLEQLKMQEYDSPHLTLLLEEEEDGDEENKKPKEKGGDIKDALEGILHGNTHYTAKADWLDKGWIEEHLIRDDNFDSLKFKFRDHMMFKRFDKTCQNERDAVIRKFVQQLLLHASEITQLDLAQCLLPDTFLQVLAEEVMSDPIDAFPRLQLINLESNVLRGPGIEALSEVIKDVFAWRFLQVILLENQKHSMSGEAEKALADAVSNSASIVVCSVSIRCPYQRKDINDAILYNMDQLRLARRDHQAKEGTLKERKRNEMELFFDSIADDEPSITEVDLVGDKKFLTLDEEEKTHSGYAFATNTTVRTIKMELLGLDDHFAEAFGEALAVNETLEKVNIDSNAITGEGMKALFEGLGENTSIEEFQVRHQHKAMATLDEEALPDLLEPNTTLLKLGVDVRSKLVRMKLDRIINANRDRVRKMRLDAKN